MTVEYEFSEADIVVMCFEAARAAGIEPTIFARQIAQESNTSWRGGRKFDYLAVNTRTGCMGLGQIHPTYARWYLWSTIGKDAWDWTDIEVQEYLFDPRNNLRVSSLIMKYFLKVYGTWEVALASYNYGPGAVSELRRRAPARWMYDLPAETRKYLGYVLRLRGK